MSKPEVYRRNADGDRTTVIHSYAPGDGNLSFVAADVEHPHRAVLPSPTREECAAACPDGWELYQEGFSWRACKSVTTSPVATPILLSLPPLMEEQTHTQTAVKELLDEYREEAQGGGPLWVAAAKDIVRALEEKTPEKALIFFKQMVRNCGKMTVACFYEGAAATLKNAIQADQRAAKKG
jgi:hypothetical protein